jgi:hypothetical protein
MRKLICLIFVLTLAWQCAYAEKSNDTPYTPEDVPRLVEAFERAIQVAKEARAALPTPKPELQPGDIGYKMQEALKKYDPEELEERQKRMGDTVASVAKSRGLPEYEDGITDLALLDGYSFRMNSLGVAYDRDTDFEVSPTDTKIGILSSDGWKLEMRRSDDRIMAAHFVADGIENVPERAAAFIYSFRPFGDSCDRMTIYGEGFIDVFEKEFVTMCTATEKKPFTWPAGDYEIFVPSIDPLHVEITLVKNW